MVKLSDRGQMSRPILSGYDEDLLREDKDIGTTVIGGKIYGTTSAILASISKQVVSRLSDCASIS